ncbi:hypothetical protein EYF80_022680 [Liparis tanakae]|uniref:Uncharacterized protein n=1 Tax=Liparis tanakae TaxID=230148 RepID=A0A4Z2HNG9_9TELE|nr:hypothetical protein EYF80_022680 [Liparis tanakae]
MSQRDNRREDCCHLVFSGYLPVATSLPWKTQIVQSGGVELLLSDTTLPHWDLIAGPTGEVK